MRADRDLRRLRARTDRMEAALLEAGILQEIEPWLVSGELVGTVPAAIEHFKETGQPVGVHTPRVTRFDDHHAREWGEYQRGQHPEQDAFETLALELELLPETPEGLRHYLMLHSISPHLGKMGFEREYEWFQERRNKP